MLKKLTYVGELTSTEIVVSTSTLTSTCPKTHKKSKKEKKITCEISNCVIFVIKPHEYFLHVPSSLGLP